VLTLTTHEDFNMGYTHYWKNTAVATAGQWQAFKADFAKVVRKARAKGIAVAGWNGSGAPVISDEKVSFNGRGDDGSYETCRIAPGIEEFSFCKTARRPYDDVVVAALTLARHHLPGFMWTSDGDVEEHADGRALAATIIGAEAAALCGATPRQTE